MSKKSTTFLYRRDWPDDDDSDYDVNDQVMDGFFGSKEPEKKPDGKCGEPKKAPEKKCPEPPEKKCQKPEPTKCPCKPKSKPRRAKSACKKPVKRAKSACKKPAKKKRVAKCPGSSPRSRNPFIIFFLTQLAKQKNRRVADVAKEAGKQWCSMDPKCKEMYIKMAKVERMRRQRKNQKGKRKCS